MSAQQLSVTRGTSPRSTKGVPCASRGKRYPAELKRRAYAMADAGMQPGDIARELGLMYRTVYHWLRALSA